VFSSATVQVYLLLLLGYKVFADKVIAAGCQPGLLCYRRHSIYTSQQILYVWR